MSKTKKSTKIELPRAVVQLHRFVSKDEYREHLSRVYLDVDPDDDGRFAAVGTDGVQMCVVTWPMIFEHGIKLPLAIPGDMLRAAAYNARAGTTWELCTTDRRVMVRSSKPGRGLYEAIGDNRPPKWQAIYSTRVRDVGATPVEAIQVNLHFLATLSGYLKSCRISGSECKLQIPGQELDPLRVDIEQGETRIRYIVMPCRP